MQTSICRNSVDVWQSHRCNFAHATTALPSLHVQNFVAITTSKSVWLQHDIPTEFDVRWKKSLSENAQRSHNKY